MSYFFTPFEWFGLSVAGLFSVVGLFCYLLRESVPDWKIPGKRIIITGGSSGIGLATARELAKQGAAAITIIARDQRKIDEV